MPNGTRICKICGCEYPYCKTVTKDRFRYQDVACCPAHGAEYFRLIELSRNPKATATEPVKETSTLNDPPLLEDDDEFEDDFDNDDEDTEIEIEK